MESLRVMDVLLVVDRSRAPPVAPARAAFAPLRCLLRPRVRCSRLPFAFAASRPIVITANRPHVISAYHHVIPAPRDDSSRHRFALTASHFSLRGQRKVTKRKVAASLDPDYTALRVRCVARSDGGRQNSALRASDMLPSYFPPALRYSPA